MKADDAVMAMWNTPLEAVERVGDETLPEAVDVAARSVERGETPLRDALLIFFAAGSHHRGANLRPAADPPTDGGAKAS